MTTTDSSAQSPLSHQTDRRPNIDWLLAIAVVLLVPFHAALILTPGGINPIKSGEDRAFLGYMAGFMHQWHMPLLFVLSGAATCFALNRRSPGEYAKERVKRLLVPLVFGTFVLIPICSYFERLNTGQCQGSYLAFYSRFFNGIYPNGNFTWAHLWFIAYLFVFSMISLPVLLWLRRDAGRRLAARLAELCRPRGGVFLLAVPIAVSEAALRARWPGFQNLVADWANFVTFDCLFVLGFVLFLDERFGQAIRRDWPLALALGVGTAALRTGLSMSHRHIGHGYSPALTLWMILRAFNMWLWILAFMGLADRFLRSDDGMLRYVREASYPFYVLHYITLAIVGFYLVRWNAGVLTRYIAIVALTILETAAAYDVLVRRTNVTRLLFGMRPRKPRGYCAYLSMADQAERNQRWPVTISKGGNSWAGSAGQRCWERFVHRHAEARLRASRRARLGRIGQ